MQKPAARKPSADTIAAAVALKRQQQYNEKDRLTAANSTSVASAPVQGTKRKRGHEDDGNKIESTTAADGGSAAAKTAEPLC